MEKQLLGIGSRVRHKEYKDGVVIQVKSDSYLITFIEFGNREILKSYENLEIIDVMEPSEDLVSFEMIEMSLIKILRRYADIQETVSLGDKWKGGKFVLYPGNAELKPYEMPIDTFFNKIVMVRDRMRVMEQKINSSKLSNDEKIELQQYITRIYGSLTSFNVLFKNKTDIFVGEKS